MGRPYTDGRWRLEERRRRSSQEVAAQQELEV
jgi:hypothetical protein